MSLPTLNEPEIKKLKHLIDEGARINQQIDDLRESLKDTVKAVSEDLDIKPAVLNKAIKAYHKNSIGDVRAENEEFEEILILAGKIV